MFRSVLVLVIVILASLSIDSWAQAPSRISFQGYLTDDLGNPIDGSQSMTFRLYRSGIEIWSEPQSVTVTDGVFGVELGSGIPIDTVAFDDPLELGVTVGKDTEMPRVSLLSAAYARALPGLYTVFRNNGFDYGYNVIGGSEHNIVGTDVVMGTISGGGRYAYPNAVMKTGATVGGGWDNTGSGAASTIAGGKDNTASGEASVVGGGNSNTASAFGAGVLGGSGNDAAGQNSTVVGGAINHATGQFSTVAGGENNWATRGFTFAGGRRAKAYHGGTFVWADSSTATGHDFESTGANQFLIRAKGGVGIGTNAPGSPLTVAGRIESESGGFKFPDGTTQTSAAATVTDYWKTGGNAGTTPGTHYIGTSDGAALHIKATGGVGIGTAAPGSPLTVKGLIESISGGFKFPDGTTQASAATTTTDHWKLGGNSGTTPGTHYIGTSDGAALQIRSNAGVTIRQSSLSSPVTLNVAGAIHSDGVDMSGLSLVMYKDTSPSLFTSPDGDGFQIYTNQNYFGTSEDALVFLKTDGSTADPDGGIAFANVGSTGPLKPSLVIRGDGDVGIGTNDPSTGLHVLDAPATNSGNLTTAYVALFENPQAVASADGIAIKIATTGNPTGDANFVGFFDGDTGLIGQIEGNGSGGVSYNTTGSDYAEYLPLLDPTERIEAGDIVGLFAGRITRSTEAADQVLVVTDQPAVVGNMPVGEDVAVGFLPVSFIGQVPVRVRGPVAAGDLLVPSGYDDGTAIAVTPTSINPKQIAIVFATAWESSTSTGITRINAAIGVDQAAAAARVIEALHSRLERQDMEITLIRGRLAALEAASIN